jgi:hypothetical protein
MAYTRADLDKANRHVTEGAERIAKFTQSIASSKDRGWPTDLAEAALKTMLITMDLMIDHQLAIAEDVGRRNAS